MDETPQWYVLRDLSRPNAKLSAFEKLTERGVRCFTPMVKKPIERRGKHGWKDVPYMRDRRIRIIGGPLHGYEGSLVTVRGTTVKRLLVELPMLLAAAVEVEPEFIQFL